MRAAVFLSFDPELQEHLEQLLAPRGARVERPFVQLNDEARPERGWFTWFGKLPPEQEWEFRAPPWVPAEGVELPDMATVDGYYVECRWPVQVAEIARDLAELSGQPLWVQGGNDVIWDARSVDPDRIVL